MVGRDTVSKQTIPSFQPKLPKSETLKDWLGLAWEMEGRKTPALVISSGLVGDLLQGAAHHVLHHRKPHLEGRTEAVWNRITTAN